MTAIVEYADGLKAAAMTASEMVAGPRCKHDMIAAWCSWCLGLDESEVPIGFEFQNAGRDLVVDLAERNRKRDTRQAVMPRQYGLEDGHGYFTVEDDD